MGKTAFDQRRENDIFGLIHLDKFGWLRSLELGRFMWPEDKYARTRADRVIRGWIERGLVIVRKLPDGAGRALVLAEAGVRLLREAGYEARSGKDWGRSHNGIWSPSQEWRHDLKSAGVLSILGEYGYSYRTEREVQRAYSGLVKVPDGLAWNDSETVWLEVESTDKRGKPLAALATAMCEIAGGSCPTLEGRKPTVVMIAFDPEARDWRGDRLDHVRTVRNAVQRAAKDDVPVTWCACEMAGQGVAGITLEREVIKADRGTRVLQVLNAGGWREEAGCLVATYGALRAIVWEDSDHGGWGYCINDEPAGIADNKSEAQRACAGLIAAR